MRFISPRWVLRATAIGSALILITLITIVLSLRFWILPHLDRWRAPIAASISASSGQNVQLGTLMASWSGWHPVLHVASITVLSPQQQTLLSLNDVYAEMSWTTLFVGELRLAQLKLSHQTFALHRKSDGTLWLGDFPLSQQSQQNGFVDWLLRQGHLELDHANLTWQDDVRTSPVLALQEVNLNIFNYGIQHYFQLSAVPPLTIAHPLDIEGRVSGRSIHQLSTWQGFFQLHLTGINLAQWQAWFTLPLGIHQGFGNIDARLQFAQQQLIALTAKLQLQQSSLQFNAQLPRLDLLHLSGWVQWKQLGAAQSIELKQVNLRSTSLNVLTPINLYLRWAPVNVQPFTQGEFRSPQLSINTAISLTPFLPLTASQQQWLTQHKPSGELKDVSVTWQGSFPHLDTFKVSGQFAQLGISSVGQQPGFSGLSGKITGNEHSGTVTLHSQNFTADLPSVFYQPHMLLNRLNIQLDWEKQANAYRFHLKQAEFANADLNGNVYGHYTWQTGALGIIDLAGGLEHGQGSALCHYIPLTLDAPAQDWLCNNILAGSADQVQFHLKGDLAKFPFHNDSQGLLDVQIPIKDGVMRPNPDFPAIDHINGLLHFSGTKMSMILDHARLYNTPLRNISAVIPDLYAHDQERLIVNGQANGAMSDFIRFANTSPIGKILDNLTIGTHSRGLAHLNLHFELPFHDIFHPLVTGILQFKQDTFLAAHGLPELGNVQGSLRFTQAGMSAQDISLQLFNRPSTLSSNTQANGHTQIRLQGLFPASELIHYVPANIASQFLGEAAWTALIDLSRTRLNSILINSNLFGLSSTLPAPLNKTASQAIPLNINTHLRSDERSFTDLHYDTLLSAQLLSLPNSNVIDRGNINFGGGAKLLSTSGVDVNGYIDRTRLEDSLKLLGGASSFPLNHVNLRIGQLQLFDRTFNNLSLHAHNVQGNWNAAINSANVMGKFVWEAPDSTNQLHGSLTAHFSMLTLPSSDVNTGTTGASVPAAVPPKIDLSWPNVVFTIDALQLGDRPLGHLDLMATPIENGLRINHLTLTHPDSKFNLSATWHPNAHPQTTAEMQLDIYHLDQFLTRWGQPNTVKNGSALLKGNADWEDAPLHIPLTSLNGKFNLQAQNGRFLKLDPGAAKLLGILSLQDIFQHLSLNWSDVFSNGFAFNDISATFLLNHGIIYAQDFDLQGPAASVRMTGKVDMCNETEQLHASISPKLNESVALAATLLGSPVVGVGVLAVQQLLGNPFGHAARVDYDVTGPWDKPLITKTDQQ